MKSQDDARSRAVIVTGTSSGIGRATALKLVEAGYTVFAGVRKETDRRSHEMLGIDRLIPLHPLEMNSPEQIDDAVKEAEKVLEREGLALYAVVNNAGGGTPAPVELLPTEMMSRELDTRITGPIRLLQRSLPLLRRGRGRIIWITTPAIIPTPYVAAIHACDFAVNCLARTLDIELARWKIPTVMVRCGGVQTPAGLRTASDVEQLLESADPEGVRLYGKALRSWAEEMVEFDKQRVPAERVGEVVLRALAASRPRSRYSVGHMAGLAALLEALPQPLADGILKRRFGGPGE